jgi:four helix bundle protein
VIVKNNIVREKSFRFSLRIIKLYQHLIASNKLYSIADQVLRSGTSIGANIEESIGGVTQKDFIQKLSISYKEARETLYWLKLLKEACILEDKLADSLCADCEEIIRILGKSLSTNRKVN